MNETPDNTNFEDITVRLLQNGRYVWTITVHRINPIGNAERPYTTDTVERLKVLDGELRDRFPNHVKESGVKFSEISED